MTTDLLALVLTAAVLAIAFAWHMHRAVNRIPEWLRRPLRQGERRNPRTWLLTGSDGMIGDRLIRTLVARGDDVILVTGDTDQASHLYGPHVHAVSVIASLSDDQRVDTIVDLAPVPLRNDGTWLARNNQTEELTALVARLNRKPALLICESSTDYYDEKTSVDLTENSSAGKTGVAVMYRELEERARRTEEHGVRVVRLRTECVVGHGESSSARYRNLLRLCQSIIAGHGSRWTNWIGLDDLIGLILHTEERARVNGAVNAVAPVPINQTQMLETITRTRGHLVGGHVLANLTKALRRDTADPHPGNAVVRPVQAEKTGYRFIATEFQEAMTAPTGNRSSASNEAIAFFNLDCPVCGTEARMCQRQIARNPAGAGMAVVHMADRPELLAAYGLEPRHLSRRLYIMEADGQMYAGIDAMIRIWRHIPAYRWRAWVLEIPGFHLTACYIYEMIVAPFIDSRFGINSARARRKILAPERAGGD